MIRLVILCFILMVSTIAYAKPNTSSAKSNKRTRSSTSSKPIDGIKALGHRVWQVKRKVVNRWKKKPRTFAKGKLSKKKKGFVIRKLRDAQECGFQVGDVIKKINRYRISSVTEAMMAHAALKNAKVLKVKFKRGKEVLTHVFKVVK